MGLPRKGIGLLAVVFVLSLSLFFLAACASRFSVKEKTPEERAGAKVIKAVDIYDYAVRFTISSDFDYTVARDSDPFKIFVELKGVEPGRFTERLISKKDGISEINFQTKPGHVVSTIAEITLQAPLETTHFVSGGVLTINVSKQAGGDKTAGANSDFDGLMEKVSSEQAEPALKKASSVTDVQFKHEDGAVQVVIKGDGKMVPEVSKYDDRLVIDIAGVDLSAITPDKVAAPVRSFNWSKKRGGVRIEMVLDSGTSSKVLSGPDSLTVSLTTADMAEASVNKAFEMPSTQMDDSKTAVGRKLTPPVSPTVTPLQTEQVSSETSKPAINSCSGKPLPCNSQSTLVLDFQNADVVSVFRLLAQESGCNIVVDTGVKGTTTMQVKDALWYEIMQLILKTNSPALGCDVQGNIIRIATRSTLDAEQKQENEVAKSQKELKDIKEESEDLVTKIFHINYAKVDDVKAFLKTQENNMLSKRGTITSDARTGSLIIRDVARVMDEIDKMIKRLDKPTAQILIEARIVEVSNNVLDTLGVSWGGYQKYNSKDGWKLGTGVAGQGSLSGNSYLADLPTAVSGVSSSIIMGFLNALGTLGLDLKLQALESADKGKILTSPRVLTMDNQKATISQGESIPYPQISTSGGASVVSAAFKDVTVNISVTPQVTPDNSIILTVTISKEDYVSMTSIGGSDAPRTKKISEDTKALIKNGETLVLGGIFKQDLKESDEGTKWLKDIPILGWLFKTDTVTKNNSEFLIFITPRILNRETEDGTSG
ncbi:MAG: type IV pilus secretin PilQ [Nitrospirae bacterium]|nr:type IV pilus secretin PilQ [Nitrospirota bacterium]MBF0617953.1 type IV pilus secretin PilQ [Nitrospirota bacterium]